MFMKQVQTIPSSISLVHPTENHSTWDYQQADNNFMRILNSSENNYCQIYPLKTHTSKQKEKQCWLEAEKDLKLDGQGNKCEFDQKRIIRFSQLQNNAMIVESESSQNSIQDDLIQQNINLSKQQMLRQQNTQLRVFNDLNKSNGMIDKNQRKKSFSKNRRYDPISTNTNSSKNLQKENKKENFSWKPLISPHKNIRKGRKRNGQNKFDQSKLILIKEINRNKELQKKVVETKKQNIQLRNIIYQFYTNQNILQKERKQIQSDQNQFKDTIKVKSKLNRAKKQLNNISSHSKVKKSGKISQIKKQVETLQELLRKLSVNLQGIQQKQRKQKINSTKHKISKQSHRFKTQAKQKASLF